LEFNKISSIIVYSNKLSFAIEDFLELDAVKSLNMNKNEILNELKYMRFLEFSKDDKKCFLNYDNSTQIFCFTKLPNNILSLKNEEIYEKINLKDKDLNIEILRLKKYKKSNKMILVINSNTSFDHIRTHFLSLKFVSFIFYQQTFNSKTY